VLPFSGVLGFWLMWYVVFLLMYAAMARMQWDAREVSHKVALVAFTTGGVLAVTIVLGQVLFVVARGLRAALHLNFWTQSLALAITMMPIVARASEVVIRLVPGTLREAAYALGSSQWRTVLNVVLPTARAGLATAVVLAMARGIGETAPVLVVSGVTKEFN